MIYTLNVIYMLRSIWKLSPFANVVTGFKPFAKGLTFQSVCKRPRPFVTRLDAKDCFRFCVDLTSLSIVRTMYRPYMRNSLEAFLSCCCYEPSARHGEREQKYKVKIELRGYLGITGLPANPSPFGLTNICTTAYVSDVHAVSTKDSSFMLPWLSLDCTHSGREGTVAYSTCHVKGVRTGHRPTTRWWLDLLWLKLLCA